eukprot:jgi/Phyca11/541695/estExt2_Genewise1Plus.C_PHYCAscaffold_70540
MPSGRSISGKHLDAKYNSLFTQLEKVVEESEWFSIVSDGWSNSKNAHFVNFIRGRSKPFFYKALYTGGVSQSGENIAAEILKVIERFGASKCLSVITDNATNMQSAWEIIETKYPHIFANGCAPHVMNLLIKDVCGLPEFSGILDNLNKVVKFVNDHKFAIAEFERLQKVLDINNTLSIPCPTRWFTQYTACKHLHEAKAAVRILAEPDSAKILKPIQNKKSVREFRKIVLDRSFWTKLAKLQRLLSFPSKLIGKLESDSGDLYRVYGSFVRLKVNG